MYCHSMHEGASCLAAPVCMSVCMFPDCSRLTPSGLLHISNLTSLRTLELVGVPDHSIYVETSWIRELPESLVTLTIMSELRWHMRAVNVQSVLKVSLGPARATSGRTGAQRPAEGLGVAKNRPR